MIVIVSNLKKNRHGAYIFRYKKSACFFIRLRS